MHYTAVYHQQSSATMLQSKYRKILYMILCRGITLKSTMNTTMKPRVARSHLRIVLKVAAC